ncbi:MAG: response regulator transcription factor [Gammaproteobacteria bacterium]|nr:response regulator transcription factor [Gammaproteobacteria bacterium]MDX2488790.1 response regulator transcription factor [Gammaproteobacteria bacterium]
MPKNCVLIVEDEEDIQTLLIYNLSKAGFVPIAVESGEEGLQIALEKRPDVIVLDLMLPGMDGLSVCRTLKSNDKTSDIPIIIASARGEESDIITGLEMGADDYITKPFSPKVLIARIKALLRRSDRQSSEQDSVFRIHELEFEPSRFEVRLAGSDLTLTSNQYRLLHFLSLNAGRVFTRYQIVNAVRGEDYIVTERAIDVQIVGLRKKLGQYSDYIETIRGIGYRFKG